MAKDHINFNFNASINAFARLAEQMRVINEIHKQRSQPKNFSSGGYVHSTWRGTVHNQWIGFKQISPLQWLVRQHNKKVHSMKLQAQRTVIVYREINGVWTPVNV